jgi:hypothetical protein
MDPIPEVLSPQQIKWQALTDFIKQWFEEPDLEVLEIALTAAASHYWAEADPVWLFIIGPASSGKTSIIINSCAGLKDALIIGDLSKDTFLSAYGKRRDHGLLSVHPDPILLFKDFTTMLTKHKEHKAEIQSQLREIYDGEYVKDRGVGGIRWKGKATCLAACTPALDRQWGLQRDLGERFLMVRLRSGDPIAASLKSAAQRGHEREIKATMQKLATAWVDAPNLKPPQNDMSPKELTQLAYLTQCLAWSRGHVVRDSMGSRTILEASPAEFPTRAFKALALLGQFAQSVRRSSGIPMHWLKRVVLDSIPPTRLQIMGCIPVGSSSVAADIAVKSERPISTIQWQLDEMEALGILVKSGPTPVYGFAGTYIEICRKAGLAAFLT